MHCFQHLTGTLKVKGELHIMLSQLHSCLQGELKEAQATAATITAARDVLAEEAAGLRGQLTAAEAAMRSAQVGLHAGLWQHPCWQAHVPWRTALYRPGCSQEAHAHVGLVRCRRPTARRRRLATLQRGMLRACGASWPR
jgi:hypothetical protein